jgi:hypothetical protein
MLPIVTLLLQLPRLSFTNVAKPELASASTGIAADGEDRRPAIPPSDILQAIAAGRQYRAQHGDAGMD